MIRQALFLALLALLVCARPLLAQDTTAGDDDDSAADDDDDSVDKVADDNKVGDSTTQGVAIERDYSRMFRVTVDEKRNTLAHRTYERIYDASWCEDRGEGLPKHQAELRELEAELRAMPGSRRPEEQVSDAQWRRLERAWRAAGPILETEGISKLPRTDVRDLRMCLDGSAPEPEDPAFAESLDICLAGGSIDKSTSYAQCLVAVAKSNDVCGGARTEVDQRSNPRSSHFSRGAKATLDTLRDRVVMISRTKGAKNPGYYSAIRSYLLADTCIEELEVVASPNSSLIIEMNTDFIGATKSASLSIQAFDQSQGVDVENYTTYKLGERDSTRVIEDEDQAEKQAATLKTTWETAAKSVSAAASPEDWSSSSLRDLPSAAKEALSALIIENAADAAAIVELRKTAARADSLVRVMDSADIHDVLEESAASQQRRVNQLSLDPNAKLEQVRQAGERLILIQDARRAVDGRGLGPLTILTTPRASVGQWRELLSKEQKAVEAMYASIFTEQLREVEAIRKEQAEVAIKNFPPGHILLGAVPKLSHGDRLKVVVTFKPEGTTGNGEGELHYRKTFYIRIADQDMKVSIDATTVLTVRASKPASLGGNNGVFNFGSGATFLVGRGHYDFWGDFFVPKFGATTLLLTWPDAGPIQVGVGPSMALFGGMLDLGVGWNLMSPYRDVAGKMYFHLGINFIQLGANIKSLAVKKTGN